MDDISNVTRPGSLLRECCDTTADSYHRENCVNFKGYHGYRVDPLTPEQRARMNPSLNQTVRIVRKKDGLMEVEVNGMALMTRGVSVHYRKGESATVRINLPVLHGNLEVIEE